MSGRKQIVEGALEMFRRAIQRVEALGDPSRVVTPEAVAQGEELVRRGQAPLWTAAEVTGLPMDEASRMARAKGRDRPTHWGTFSEDNGWQSDVERFKIPGKSGFSNPSGLLFTADDPLTAGSYTGINPGNAGSIYPLRVRDAPEKAVVNELGYDDVYDAHDDAVALALKHERSKVRNSLDFGSETPHKLFPHIYPAPDDTHPRSTVRVFTNPDDLRSPHAAFDPANEGTGYLLGSHPVAGTAAGALALWQLWKNKLSPPSQ